MSALSNAAFYCSLRSSISSCHFAIKSKCPIALCNLRTTMTIVVMPSNASQEQVSSAKLTIPSLPFTVHFPCLQDLPVTSNFRWSFQIRWRIQKWSLQVPLTLRKPPINLLLTADSSFSISLLLNDKDISKVRMNNNDYWSESNSSSKNGP